MSTPDPTNPAITQRGSQPIDDNDKPISGFGALVSSSKTLSGDSTTVAVPIFSVVGTVEVIGLYGIVTTALGNNTAAYWRLNDGSNQSNITLNTGTSLTDAVAGASIVKKGLATAALTLLNADQERVSEPTTLETAYFSPFVVQQITGGVSTNIEFVYTTSDSPTMGAIQFFAYYLPLSQGSYLTAV